MQTLERFPSGSSNSIPKLQQPLFSTAHQANLNKVNSLGIRTTPIDVNVLSLIVTFGHI